MLAPCNEARASFPRSDKVSSIRCVVDITLKCPGLACLLGTPTPESERHGCNGFITWRARPIISAYTYGEVLKHTLCEMLIRSQMRLLVFRHSLACQASKHHHSPGSRLFSSTKFSEQKPRDALVETTPILSSSSDFALLAGSGMFVDKSPALQDFLRYHMPIHLLLRPRRSGKTTLLCMFR